MYSRSSPFRCLNWNKIQYILGWANVPAIYLMFGQRLANPLAARNSAILWDCIVKSGVNGFYLPQVFRLLSLSGT